MNNNLVNHRLHSCASPSVRSAVGRLQQTLPPCGPINPTNQQPVGVAVAFIVPDKETEELGKGNVCVVLDQARLY